MRYSTHDIAQIVSSSVSNTNVKREVTTVSVDTRQIVTPRSTMFVALPGTMHDGHIYIQTAYDIGVRSFLVKQEIDNASYPSASFIKVSDTLQALQALAIHHRSQFPNLKTLAITGSNGKTIVKEWLYQMLQDRYTIVKSPKSYNSQIGVALSVLNIETKHNLAIFEAGISKLGEMQRHEQMIQPSVGLITNVLQAHDEGFPDRATKAKEKLSLFSKVDLLIRLEDSQIIDEVLSEYFSKVETFSVGHSSSSDLEIKECNIGSTSTLLTLRYIDTDLNLKLRWTDQASIENMLLCIATLVHLEVPAKDIQTLVDRVSGLEMRLEISDGIHGSLLINDAYSADLDALQIAFEFTDRHAAGRDRIAILSRFEQSGLPDAEVMERILTMAARWSFSEIIYISEDRLNIDSIEVKLTQYNSKSVFYKSLGQLGLENKAILVKGARRYQFEEISKRLAANAHTATLRINLNHLEDNLRVYKQLLQPTTDIIAVVKASAYGSGSAEIAHVLQSNGIKYLAVAFVNEGVALRKAGIHLPIMVLNPDRQSTQDLFQYDLEPEVYSIPQLKDLIEDTQSAEKQLSIHIKMDTGMHRLGYVSKDIPELVDLLKEAKFIKVASVFSHLASSEDPNDDSYTKSQFALFEEMSSTLADGLGYSPKRHILNSGGISRFPNQQHDLVRLGIGMYGLDHNRSILQKLQKVHQLTAHIIQTKAIKRGQSIGYNRKTILQRDSKIAVVNIGYADGLPRNLGNQKFEVLTGDQRCPILGNICMDLIMIDITDLPSAQVGDEVIIFGPSLPIEDLAIAAGTIPYEVLSRISSRVQRRFIKS